MTAANRITASVPAGYAHGRERNIEAARAVWLAQVRSAQTADGGFCHAPGRPASTETTALALLALTAAGSHSDGVDKARQCLRTWQRDDGSWPLFEGVNEGSWATAWALLALQDIDEDRERLRRGVAWLVRREGRTVGGLAWLLFWLTPADESTSVDPTLVGWPWHRNSFSWVEPTAVALLALKKMRPSLGSVFPAQRVAEGERVLYDRECVEGGWNYGNRAVLGDNLPPYPDSTAIALIALQDQAAVRNGKSLDALRRLIDDPHASGLALALGAICLSLYGVDPDPWRRRLAPAYERTQFLGETRTLALALLATSDSSIFRVT